MIGGSDRPSSPIKYPLQYNPIYPYIYIYNTHPYTNFLHPLELRMPDIQDAHVPIINPCRREQLPPGTRSSGAVGNLETVCSHCATSCTGFRRESIPVRPQNSCPGVVLHIFHPVKTLSQLVSQSTILRLPCPLPPLPQLPRLSCDRLP